MSESMSQKIAILLATYNGGKYIRVQLDSILNQSYDNWVVYVHDDGSNDETMDIVNEYIQNYPEHFCYVEGAPTGCARNNFMYLFSKVESEIYMCCDQDDYWIPDKIECTLEKMNEIIEDVPCLVFTDLEVVDQNLNTISGSMNIYQKLGCNDTSVNHILVQNIVTGSTMMVNRQLSYNLIKYNNIDKIIMHDWWAGIIAAEKGKIVYIDKPTIKYRQHASNSVGAKKMDFSLLTQKLKKDERDAIRLSLKKTRDQAKEFCDCFNIKAESKVYIYSKIELKGKLARLACYKKHSFRKSSIFRTIGLYFWG